jgi:hypothetical protein
MQKSEPGVRFSIYFFWASLIPARSDRPVRNWFDSLSVIGSMFGSMNCEVYTCLSSSNGSFDCSITDVAMIVSCGIA